SAIFALLGLVLQKLLKMNRAWDSLGDAFHGWVIDGLGDTKHIWRIIVVEEKAKVEKEEKDF
ncbi:hypothetical protein MKW98_012675, partial [Papaver atlanticum]